MSWLKTSLRASHGSFHHLLDKHFLFQRYRRTGDHTDLLGVYPGALPLIPSYFTAYRCTFRVSLESDEIGGVSFTWPSRSEPSAHVFMWSDHATSYQKSVTTTMELPYWTSISWVAQDEERISNSTDRTRTSCFAVSCHSSKDFSKPLKLNCCLHPCISRFCPIRILFLNVDVGIMIFRFESNCMWGSIKRFILLSQQSSTEHDTALALFLLCVRIQSSGSSSASILYPRQDTQISQQLDIPFDCLTITPLPHKRNYFRKIPRGMRSREHSNMFTISGYFLS